MVDEGAQIIDLGGESTRPGSDPVSEKEEIRRVIPILEKLSDQFLISIDTTKEEVARLSLELGAHIINDVLCNEKLLISHRNINLDLSSCTLKGILRYAGQPSYMNPFSEIRSFENKKSNYSR